jgi:uncharacterized glyoxalase superfamily protein PhnB
VAEDFVRGWAPIYPHLRYRDPVAAIAWLERVFGLRERMRMPRPNGGIIVSKLESPGGGLAMVAGYSADFLDWIRGRVPDARVSEPPPWPHLFHSVTVLVADVDAHHATAMREGATVLMPPTDHPWGLRTYAALDIEGHQWEFAQVLRTVEPEFWGAMRIE